MVTLSYDIASIASICSKWVSFICRVATWRSLFSYMVTSLNTHILIHPPTFFIGCAWYLKVNSNSSAHLSKYDIYLTSLVSFWNTIKHGKGFSNRQTAKFLERRQLYDLSYSKEKCQGTKDHAICACCVPSCTALWWEPSACARRAGRVVTSMRLQCLQGPSASGHSLLRNSGYRHKA